MQADAAAGRRAGAAAPPRCSASTLHAARGRGAAVGGSTRRGRRAAGPARAHLVQHAHGLDQVSVAQVGLHEAQQRQQQALQVRPGRLPGRLQQRRHEAPARARGRSAAAPPRASCPVLQAGSPDGSRAQARLPAARLRRRCIVRSAEPCHARIAPGVLAEPAELVPSRPGQHCKLLHRPLLPARPAAPGGGGARARLCEMSSSQGKAKPGTRSGCSASSAPASITCARGSARAPRCLPPAAFLPGRAPVHVRPARACHPWRQTAPWGPGPACLAPQPWQRQTAAVPM